MQYSGGRLALCVLGVAALCTVVGVTVYYTTKEDNYTQLTLEKCITIVHNSETCIDISACTKTNDKGWPQPDPKPPSADYMRLPDTLTPTHYEIELRPDFYDIDPDNFTLDGNVTITFHVTKATDVITVHNRQLVINRDEITVWYEDGTFVGVEDTEEAEWEFYHIKLDEELEEGKVIKVFISYTAPLKDDKVGIYYSTYYQQGQLKYLIGSQFSPIDARKAFPCQDEPGIKSFMKVSLWRKDGVVSLTNMPNISSEVRGEWIVDYFEETPMPMSTYLMGFALADFDYLDNTTTTGLKEKYVRVWAAPEAKENGQLEFANEVAGAIFDELENVFAVEFDLEKLDMFPIRTFKFSAMENWGLVTYDDVRLLIHPNFTSYYDMQQLVRTMSHELGHMWFGNKVTHKWWDDVWMKEAFASYFENYGISNGRTPINVEWEHLYVVQTILRAYGVDDEGQAVPIRGFPTTLAEIENVFSSIIYAKGSSVVRMWRKFLFDSESMFLAAQTNYLTINENRNANYTDLINAWEPHVSTDLPVTFSTMLESWILQNGHPVITVNRDQADPEHVQLSQTMFLMDDHRPIKEVYPPPFNHTWVVPFTYVTEDNPATVDMEEEWMNLIDKDITVSGLTSDKWILGNPGLYGFYRVNYGPENWQLLQKQLESDHTVIDVRNRAQLLYDSIMMSKAGIVSADLPINLTKYLSSETDYVPWFAAEESISRLDTILTLTEYYGAFRDHVRDSILPVYNDLGWDDEGDDEDYERKYLRKLALELSCLYMNDACIAQASVLFNEWVNQGERSRSVIDPAQRELIGCTHLANRAGLGDWDNLFAVYQEVRNYHKIERARIRNALACTKDQWTLIRYTNWAFAKADEIHEDDYSSVLSQVAKNPAGRDIVWSMLEEKWEQVPGRTSVLGTITNYFTTSFQLQKLESFFELHPPSTPSETETYEANRYKVEANIRWRDRMLDANPTFT